MLKCIQVFVLHFIQVEILIFNFSYDKLCVLLDISPNDHFDFEDTKANDPPQDPNPSMESPMVDTMQDEDLEEDLIFKDMYEFCQLQSCFNE